MWKLVVTGVPPWDGEYEFEDFSFTNGEFYEIRKISGTRASTLFEELDANDTATYVAVAKLILERHGKHASVDDLLNAKVGSLRLELAAQETGDAEDPPPLPPADEPNGGTSGGGEGSEPGGD